MILSKSIRRIGLLFAAAAVVFGMLSFASPGVASAQTPPATFYGKGLKSGDRVEAFIGGKSCGSATANAAGEWSISVPTTAACAPTAGAAVSFTLNGAAASASPAATWQGGGLPPDVANGYVLGAAQATPTPTGTVAAPKTGNAGLLGGGSGVTSTWALATALVVAVGAVAGARALAGRRA